MHKTHKNYFYNFNIRRLEDVLDKINMSFLGSCCKIIFFKRTHRILIIIISIVLISSNAYSKVGSNAGYAGAFLRMGLGARALGMGNTGVASSADGFASYYNPAALPYISKRHLSVTYYFLSLDREFHYAGFALPLKPTAGASVSWMHAGVSDIQGRTFTGAPDEIYETGEDVIYLSFAYSFHRKFSIGLSFKILNHTLPDLKGNGLGFDVGLLFKPIDLIAIGLQFKDISSSYTWNTQDLFEEKGGNYIEKFPQIVKVGIAVKQSKNLLIAGDVEMSDKEDYRVYFGAEYIYRELAYLRMGMNSASPTLGAGLAYGLLGNLDTHLDYCAVFGLVGEGVTHAFSWEFKF